MKLLERFLGLGMPVLVWVQQHHDLAVVFPGRIFVLGLQSLLDHVHGCIDELVDQKYLFVFIKVSKLSMFTQEIVCQLLRAVVYFVLYLQP